MVGKRREKELKIHFSPGSVRLLEVDTCVPDRRALITGVTGLLGRAVYKEFVDNGWDTVGYGYKRARPKFEKVNLLDPGAVRQIIQDFKPHAVIHCAAERRPDVAESQPEYTRQLNVCSSGCIAKESAEIGAFLIYMSTDYIFDGSKPPYREHDTPNPLNQYGKTKLEGERIVLQNHPGAAVLRVPLLYGKIEKLEESSATALFAKVQCHSVMACMDHWGQKFPTHVDDVARVCRQLSERRLQDPSISGIFHWSGNERMTKYEMACTMAEIFNLPSNHLRPDTDCAHDGALRPRDVQLDCSRLERMGIGQRTPFRIGIRRCLWPYLLDKQWRQTVFH
ncbi:methionine adenosyltransferase 2 subunit beta [Mustelus asterias]